MSEIIILSFSIEYQISDQSSSKLFKKQFIVEFVKFFDCFVFYYDYFPYKYNCDDF